MTTLAISEATQTAPVRSAWALQDPLLTAYYDEEWGMPVRDESGVFERLTLEAFQSGLSWLTILRRREAFRAAFEGFDIAKIAEFTEEDVDRLLADESIIRNRMKVEATVANAKATIALHARGETLSGIVWSHMPEVSPVPQRDAEVPSTSAESTALAKALKREGFSFVGPTTMYALMGAIGVVDVHIVDSHRRGCSGLWNRDGSRVSAD